MTSADAPNTPAADSSAKQVTDFISGPPYSLSGMLNVLERYADATGEEAYRTSQRVMTRMTEQYGYVTGLTVARVPARRGTRFDYTPEQFALLLRAFIRSVDEELSTEHAIRLELNLPSTGYSLLATPEQLAAAVGDGGVDVGVGAGAAEVTALRREVGELREQVAALKKQQGSGEGGQGEQAVQLQQQVTELQESVRTFGERITALEEVLQEKFGDLSAQDVQVMMMCLPLLAQRLGVDWPALFAEAEELVAGQNEAAEV